MIDWQQLVHDAVYYPAFHLARTVTAFVQRDSYLYWPFLVSTVLIAFGLWLYRRRSARGFLSEYGSGALWWHVSARADYKLFLLNGVIMPLVVAALLLNERSIAGTLHVLLGTVEPAVPASVAAKLLFTLLFFIAYDFGRFVSHCLLHDVPFLWEIHKVHHSAEVLTPMTSYRAHPLELLIMAWGPVLATTLVLLAFQLAGMQAVSAYTFLGVHVVLWAFNLVDNLRHSPVWLSYGPRVGRWLISPAQHQLHHSCEARHFGCNRGFDLALWDRLYGTLYAPGYAPESFRLGLGDQTESRYHSLSGMYLLPLSRALSQIRQGLRRRERRQAA
jgi:sterol desaturase/sphingolipid hydroxylase (fatty acid hydroxylase superfamily)